MQETQNASIHHLIKNPHETGRQHTEELERLSQAYPASNFLHILLAKSKQNEPGFDDALNKAAIYSADRKTLFHLIHQPEKLLGGKVEEVIEVERVESVEDVIEEGKSEIEEVESVEKVFEEGKSEIVNLKSEIEEVESVEDVIEEGKPEIVNLKSEIPNPKSQIEDEVFDEIAETPFAFINQENKSNIPDGESPQVAAETWAIDEETFEEINEAFFIKSEIVNPKSEINPDGESPQTTADNRHIDEETFEEINEASFIDIKTDNAAQVADGESPQMAAETGHIDEETFEEITETPFTKSEISNPKSERPASEIGDEVFEEIQSSEYNKSEIVNPKFQIPSLESFHIDSVIPSLEELPTENTSVQTVEQSKNQPSRYHDEKMPYSFMWWLDKTRQEHAQTYQPYASPFRPDTSAQIETAPAAKEPLEQQYIEHIFYLRSIEELEQSTTQSQTVPFAVDKKETKIIEKFIREEPQISTPRPEKLDVENKARKSTEDKLDMVSETLAKIYTEQMLYHKAIDTYQKLGLKYPDKSGYFAARIDELEQKIR